MSTPVKTDEIGRRVVVAVVGMDSIGKTCLYEYVPMVFDRSDVIVPIDTQRVAIEVRDTSYRGDYYELFPQLTPDVDIFLFCVSLVDESSLDNGRRDALPLLRDAIYGSDDSEPVVPNARIYLIGLKNDLANDPAVIAELEERNETILTMDDLLRFRDVVESENEGGRVIVFEDDVRIVGSFGGEEALEGVREAFVGPVRDVILKRPRRGDRRERRRRCLVM